MKFAKRKNMTLLFLLFMSMILMGIGYASIQSVTGEITGKASSKMQDGVFITNVEYVSDVDASLSTSQIERFVGSMMKSTVELSKSNLESQITYKVTVYNSSTEEVPFTEVLYGDKFYDNADIIFELSGFTIGQSIGPKETKDIIITFKYNTSTGTIPDNTVLNSYLKFKLDIPNRMVLASSIAATGNYLTGTITKDKIKTISFKKGEKPNSRDVIMFDASEKQDESIIGYYTAADEDGLYNLTFVSDNIIYANKNAQFLFQNLSNITSFDFENFSTFGVTNMYATFEACNQMTTFELGNLDISRVTDVSYMFTQCQKLESLNLNKWNTSNVTSMRYMFSNSKELKNLNIVDWDTSKVRTLSYMFNSCSSLKELDINNWNTSRVTDISGMFNGCSRIETIKLDNIDTGNVLYMSSVFNGCNSLVNIDVSKWNTGKVIYMNEMFYNCKLLTKIDVSKWNTSNVQGMRNLFSVCNSLTTLDVSGWDTSSAKTMSNMFNDCSKLTQIDVSNFNTSKVTDMAQMFRFCSSLTTLDVSRFDTSKVTNMDYMFAKISKVANLDVSKFNTSKVTSMIGTFQDCNSLKALDLSSWSTDNVTNMQSMFGSCSSITELDLSSFNTSKVTDIRLSFYHCGALKTIYVSEFDSTTNTGWTTANINTSYAGAGVFESCYNLVGGNGTVFDASNGTMTYARIDTDDTPGYFTKKGQKPSEYVPAEPYLPTGFSQVEGTTLDNGFTIQDSTGNQYVWVEVPKTKYVYSTAGLKVTEFTDEEYTKIETDLHTYTSDYRQDGFVDEYSSDELTGLTSDEYTALKYKMLKSIYQNEGFYIGKYEAGIEDEPRKSDSANTELKTPVIKQNVYPYNYVTCGQAQALASSMEKGGYNTSLMFGVQWDLVMKYLENKGVAQADLKTDSTSWGNYSNNAWNITNTKLKYSTDYGWSWKDGAYGTKDSSTSMLLSTGASETFCKQGIYDLAGNIFQFTLEHCTSLNRAVQRAGCFYKYGNSYTSAYHYPTGTYDRGIFEDGFRVALY